MRKALSVMLVLGLLPLAASAEEDRSGLYLGPVFELAGEFGGDDVAWVLFEDGTADYITTGDGVRLTAGGHLRPHRRSPFDLRATVGYKVMDTRASNADPRMQRVTWELLPSIRVVGPLWIGAGVTHHSNIKLDMDGLGPDLKFEPATGATFELGWHFDSASFVGGSVAATYTAMRYRDEFDNGYDANTFGLRGALTFGWTCCRDQSARNFKSVAVPAGEPRPVIRGPAQSKSPAPETSSGPVAATVAGALLRGQPGERPAQGVRAARSLPEGTRVRLVTQLENEAGKWWYVEIEGGSSGWLRERELVAIQR